MWALLRRARSPKAVGSAAAPALFAGPPVLCGVASSFATNPDPISIAIADLNSDGRLDLATANQSTANLSDFLASGAPSRFGGGTTITKLNSCRPVNLSATNSFAAVRVWLGSSGSLLGSWTRFPCAVAIRSWPLQKQRQGETDSDNHQVRR